MPEITYTPQRFNRSSWQIVDQAEAICAQYKSEGYDLTLRQLYYQFVSKGLIANSDKEYKRLGQIISKARLAGAFDWNYIIDRTRNLRGNSHWDSPAEIIEGASQSYQIDKWTTQDTRVEVWVEKDALVGVLQRCCPIEDVDYFSCRGYVSQSEMWAAAQRLRQYVEEVQQVVILHMGDHDPSGLDMTRDIRERLSMFLAVDTGEAEAGLEPEDYVYAMEDLFLVNRIALNMNQIREYNPPPNPAKLTDARAEGYIREHGYESWELDALEPKLLTELVRTNVQHYKDDERYALRQSIEREERELLALASTRWTDVVEFLETDDDV